MSQTVGLVEFNVECTDNADTQTTNVFQGPETTSICFLTEGRLHQQNLITPLLLNTNRFYATGPESLSSPSFIFKLISK